MNWLNAFGETVQTQPEALRGFGVAKDMEPTKPSAFQGTGDALEKALPFSFYQSLSGVNELMADRVEVNYGLDNNEDAFSDFKPTQEQKEQVADRLRQEAKFARLKAQNDYTPNPETTGQAAMMIHGLTGSLAKAIGYTVATGGSGILAAPLFGADLGLYEAGKLRDKGVDASTARTAGAITGTVNAVGMALPGAVGTSYVKSMLFGGAVNPLTDISEQASIKFVLDNANYSKQAQEYDPFDPVNLGVSAGMGIAFGALGARANRAQARYEAAEAAAQPSAPQTPEGQTAPAANMNKSVLDSIQNRDRSSKESRLQMEKIAAAPNFNLLRESRSLDQGAPIIAYVPEDMNILWGKRVDVSADPSSEPMTMRYAVVDADDVLTSNAVDGSSNPGFTDPTVSGARAIAGNGRIAGLQGAYRQVKATKYRADLTQDSKEFGISKRQIKKMKNPILVRVMDDADVVEGIGEASNRTGTLKLNPAEQAAQDARNVRLEEVEFTKDGEITQKSMDEFVKRTPDKEGLIDSNGNALYDNIARRMRPAIFAAAFSDTRIINRFITNSPEDKKIMNVLQSVATEVVRLKKIKGELDFSPDLLEAVADVFETRREAKKINGKGHEKELTGSLMEESATPAQRYFRDILLSANPERLQEILARFREVAEQESGGAGFFEAVTKDQVFETVKSEFDQRDAAINSIKPSDVDAAMELQSANVIQNDQPTGTRGDVNKSLADERRAAEQLDNGERVEVSGEGVDPEVMDKNVSDFVTRFVKELVGAGAEKKVAEMGAKVHDAFFETLGIRLGKSRKELEQEYELRVQRAESAEGTSEATIRHLEKSGDILFQNENAPRGIYTPGERVITLMQSANESTFIHESGHYFLDVLTDVAMKENAPAQVKADVQTLMDWFGVKDLDEWRNLSIDEQRASHEQFARGFEQYLREGEAPSTALEKVFKAFKDWLTKIYKSSEELQVEISPEVRAVYDRLLATDEQIRAKEEIDTPSLFGGMEPEEPPANPVVKAVQQTAEQVIDQAPISEDSKARIRETLGINQPEPQTGENHPHYGIPNEETFIDQNLETSAANDPNAFIVLDDGREVSMGDYMREIEAEQRQEFDRANSVSEAAQCMLRNGAFDDVF